MSAGELAVAGFLLLILILVLDHLMNMYLTTKQLRAQAEIIRAKAQLEQAMKRTIFDKPKFDQPAPPKFQMIKEEDK